MNVYWKQIVKLFFPLLGARIGLFLLSAVDTVMLGYASAEHVAVVVVWRVFCFVDARGLCLVGWFVRCLRSGLGFDSCQYLCYNVATGRAC